MVIASRHEAAAAPCDLALSPRRRAEGGGEAGLHRDTEACSEAEAVYIPRTAVTRGTNFDTKQNRFRVCPRAAARTRIHGRTRYVRVAVRTHPQKAIYSLCKSQLAPAPRMLPPLAEWPQANATGCSTGG